MPCHGMHSEPRYDMERCGVVRGLTNGSHCVCVTGDTGMRMFHVCDCIERSSRGRQTQMSEYLSVCDEIFDKWKVVRFIEPTWLSCRDTKFTCAYGWLELRTSSWTECKFRMSDFRTSRGNMSTLKQSNSCERIHVVHVACRAVVVEWKRSKVNVVRIKPNGADKICSTDASWIVIPINDPTECCCFMINKIERLRPRNSLRNEPLIGFNKWNNLATFSAGQVATRTSMHENHRKVLAVILPQHASPSRKEPNWKRRTFRPCHLPSAVLPLNK